MDLWFDLHHFGIAVERAEALGIKVGQTCLPRTFPLMLVSSWQVGVVVVGEDCAVESVDKTAGRRGLVGIVTIMKV